jgi:hypothetical protein
VTVHRESSVLTLGYRGVHAKHDVTAEVPGDWRIREVVERE